MQNNKNIIAGYITQTIKKLIRNIYPIPEIDIKQKIAHCVDFLFPISQRRKTKN